MKKLSLSSAICNRTFYIAFLFVLLFNRNCFSQNFVWAKSISGTGSETGLSIAIDGSGNVYTTGQFTGTADFDPGAGTFNLSTAGGNIFISKLDASGNFLWAKSMGGTSFNAGNSIAIDGSGNIYITGRYTGTVDFDPGAGTFNLTCAGSYDSFISKLDASGNFLWAKSMGGTDFDIGNSIAVDGSGNVYTTGSFQGIVDFDPGSGTFNLISSGYSDIFISKLDVSGNFLWAKNMGGTNANYGAVGLSIAVDGSGNVYTTGSFQDAVDFDPGAGTYSLITAGSNDIFISKLDASGNFIWAKNTGGINNDRSFSIVLDGTGNIYTTGFFKGTVDFDPGTGSFNLISGGSEDIFISKLDASGNFVWAKSMGGTGDATGSSIALDGSGNVYTAGTFQGTVDFDPGTGYFNLSSAGGYDIFISKLNASGNFVWARGMGGTSDDWGQSIALDGTGNVYATGSFQGTADFDRGSGTFNLTSPGGYDSFVVKFGILPTSTGEENNREKISVFPNPFSTQAELRFSQFLNNATLTLDNCLGQTVQHIENINGQTIVLNRDNLANGLYYVRLTEENKTITACKLIIANQ